LALPAKPQCHVNQNLLEADETDKEITLVEGLHASRHRKLMDKVQTYISWSISRAQEEVFNLMADDNDNIINCWEKNVSMCHGVGWILMGKVRIAQS
jgi:hypothetical protein